MRVHFKKASIFVIIIVIVLLTTVLLELVLQTKYAVKLVPHSRNNQVILVT